MSTVNSEIRFAVQAPSYITSNPSKVLANGEPIFFNNGTYVFGDGTTALNALTVYGSSSAWGSITGTLSNQTDLQNALNAKLDSATAAATYQPIGSYLTSSAIGVTVQGYSANTTLLGNSTTGSGSIVLATSPTFATQITTPVIYGSGSASGTLTIDSTSASTKGAITFGTASSSNIYNFNVGTSSASVRISGLVSQLGNPAIYFNQASPSISNANIYGTGTTTSINGTASVYLQVSTENIIAVSSGGTSTFTSVTRSTGSPTPFTFTPAANTGQTASTNIPNFRVNGSTKTWAAGTITNQYWNYFTANTAAFASASTLTNSYGLFVEAATAGTNATITNNYAAGFGGNVNIVTGELRQGGVKIVGARDTGWTAFTNTTNKATSYDTATVTLQQLAERVAAMQAALTTHGLIGA